MTLAPQDYLFHPWNQPCQILKNEGWNEWNVCERTCKRSAHIFSMISLKENKLFLEPIENTIISVSHFDDIDYKLKVF